MRHHLQEGFVTRKSLVLAGLLLILVSTQLQATHTAAETGRAEPRIESAQLRRSTVAINAFVNDPAFGSISNQFRTLARATKLRRVRSLFAWTDQIQPVATADRFWGFYDDIVASMPRSFRAIVVTSALPSWVAKASNGNHEVARELLLKEWLEPLLKRYGESSKIEGWQIWNEPNDAGNPDNVTLGFVDDPDAYVEFLSRAAVLVRRYAPRAKVIMAATTAINQNFPDTLNYNRRMVEAGVLNATDVYAAHYYGSQYENLIRPDGIIDFFRSISLTTWITESGARGFSQQTRYVSLTWRILLSAIPRIQRFYYYCDTESHNPNTTYGLRVPNRNSSLVRYLRRLKR